MNFQIRSIASIFCLCFASTAFAQDAPANGTIIGNWRLACQATAVNQTSCVIAQTLSVGAQNTFLAEVTLRYAEIDGSDRTIMAVSTPTNMRLSAQPGYRVSDSDETLPLTWRTCTPQICTASRILEESEISALRANPSFVLGYHPMGNPEPLVFEISLDGVSAGLDALSN